MTVSWCVVLVSSTQQNVSDTYAEEGTLHVEAHFLIVEGHDLDKALERAHLDRNRGTLRCLADNLHDVVALAL